MLKMIGLVSEPPRSFFEAAQSRYFETEGFVGREVTCGPPKELAPLDIQG